MLNQDFKVTPLFDTECLRKGQTVRETDIVTMEY